MMEQVPFPELRALMARHGITQAEMSSVCGITYRTFTKKIRGLADFTISEMWKIKDYFAGLDSEKTIDEIFFDWKFTKVNSR